MSQGEEQWTGKITDSTRLFGGSVFHNLQDTRKVKALEAPLPLREREESRRSTNTLLLQLNLAAFKERTSTYSDGKRLHEKTATQSSVLGLIRNDSPAGFTQGSNPTSSLPPPPEGHGLAQSDFQNHKSFHSLSSASDFWILFFPP